MSIMHRGNRNRARPMRMTEVIHMFDDYRDEAARRDMVAFVARQRAIDPPRALADLRGLNHVGLAHVYRDMLQASGQGHRVDYDPSEYARS